MKQYTYTRPQPALFRHRVSMIQAVVVAFAVWIMAFTPSAALAQCFIGPGSARVTGNVPFGDPINWANPNRCTVSDDLYSRITLNPGETGKYLSTEDYGFVLPATATIVGIEVRVEKHEEAGAEVFDGSARLQLGGSIVGNDYADLSNEWPTSDKTAIYGGPTDTWGLSLTPADIMDPSFGFAISATRTGGVPNLEARVDYIEMIIYFSDPGGCILPVSLSAFQGRAMGQEIVLDWASSFETGSSFYTVERSSNGTDFEAIGTVNATGSAAAYQFTDATPGAGSNFYRLQQTDLNGRVQQFQTIEVMMDAGSLPAVTAWPNPARETLNLRLNLEDGPAQVQLHTPAGHTVYTAEASGTTDLQVDLSALPRGLYILEITQSGKRVTTQKIIAD